MDIPWLEAHGRPCPDWYAEEALPDSSVDRDTFIRKLNRFCPSDQRSPYAPRGIQDRIRYVPAISSTVLWDRPVPRPCTLQSTELEAWQKFFDAWLPLEGCHQPLQWLNIAFQFFEDHAGHTLDAWSHESLSLQRDDFSLTGLPQFDGPLQPAIRSDNYGFMEDLAGFLVFLLDGLEGLSDLGTAWARERGLTGVTLTGELAQFRVDAEAVWNRIAETGFYADWDAIMPFHYEYADTFPHVKVPLSRPALAAYRELDTLSVPLHKAFQAIVSEAGFTWPLLESCECFESSEPSHDAVLIHRATGRRLEYDAYVDQEQLWWSILLEAWFPDHVQAEYQWNTP